MDGEQIDDRTLYRRVESASGRTRYEPVCEYDLTEYLADGDWLVTIRPGRRSLCRRLYPKIRAEDEMVLRECAEGMASAMTEAAKFRPSVTPMTDRERAAWAALQEAIGGNAWPMLHGASWYEIALAGITAAAERYGKHPEEDEAMAQWHARDRKRKDRQAKNAKA
ncbi:MAG: hypothetical protein KKH61_07525 [Gammaproteobacteria bacterium]|nr:hypothetical protein [Gammaproteobacteria bacterium]